MRQPGHMNRFKAAFEWIALCMVLVRVLNALQSRKPRRQQRRGIASEYTP